MGNIQVYKSMQNKDIEVDISDEACKEYDLYHGDLVQILYSRSEFIYATVIGVGMIPKPIDVKEKRYSFANEYNKDLGGKFQSNIDRKIKNVLWLCPDGEKNIRKKIMYTAHKIKLITKAKDRRQK